MVRSIGPKRETIRGAQRYSGTAAVFGARVAETISASGHARPHQQAGHMTASDPIKTLPASGKQGAVHIWAPASAGEAGLSERLHAMVTCVNESEHEWYEPDGC